MRLRVEGEPEELREKGSQLIRALAERLAPESPEAAVLHAILQKALPRKEQSLKYPALRKLQSRTSQLYDEQMKLMVRDIERVLDRKLKKAVTPIGGLTPGGYRKVAKDHYVKEELAPKISSKALELAVQKIGGKVKPHKFEHNSVVVKVPKSQGKWLAELKQKYHLAGEVKEGGKYLVMPVDLAALAKAKAHKAEEPAPQPSSEPKGLTKPSYATADWKPPATIQEAQEWCGHHGIHADFPDLSTARETTRALSEQHPAVLKHVQFVGTQKQLLKWATKNKEQAEFAKHGKHGIDITTSKVLNEKAAVAVAHPMGKKPYTRSAIVIRGDWYDAGRADKKSKADLFSLSNNLVDVVRHECGHVEAFVMRHMNTKDGKNVWSNVWKAHVVPKLKGAPPKSDAHAKLSSEVSMYGTTNPHEMWAELSVLRRNPLRPIPEWVQKATAAMGIDSGDWHKMGAPA